MPESDAFVLGIDLGSNSLGWALIALIDNVPASLVRCGVRVFPAGIVNEKGTEKSRNMDRRVSRLQRRQTWRRARRLKKIFNLLQRSGLLPADRVRSPEERQDFLNRLDGEILASPWFAAQVKSGRYAEPQHVMPYILRARALDERLEPYFLGRALYHLAQRRGFFPNRTRDTRGKNKDEERGKVESGIQDLKAKLDGRTLGQYLATTSPFSGSGAHDPADPLKDKVRGIWTGRGMYQEEFGRVWSEQAKYHPEILSDSLRGELHRAIFDQRGPRNRRNAIGKCEFEPAERRAPAHLVVSQRFRMLQAVNNLRVWRRGTGERPRPLSGEERSSLVGLLEREGDVEFKRVREIPGFEQYSFNLQRDKAYARMPGDNTGAAFYKIFGEGWFERDHAEQERIVADTLSIRSVRDEREMTRRGEKYLRNQGVQDLEGAGENFLAIRFEDGRMGLSVKAMKRFMPLLERGFCFGDMQRHYVELENATPQLIELVGSGTQPAEACQRILTARPCGRKPHDYLPPIKADEVQRYVGQVRNPVVLRSLTELRRVVNAIVRRYGKPKVIRIELARELKKSKEEREKIWRENNARERSNDQLIGEIRAETGSYRPGDLTRYRLWQESKDGKCPYCLEAMSRGSLFVDGSLQVDHVIPRGLMLDDSFTNLVLCHAECNQKKGDRTPFQAFADTERWEAIVARAKSFGEPKLRRFKMADEELTKFCERFRSSQLNDTAYASRIAGDYVGLLFGGREDESGIRVQVSSGGTTKFFREVWRLNGILNDGPTAEGGTVFKTRNDHRHHAIDAAVIAATDPGMVQRLNNAAKYGATHERFRRECMERYENGPIPGASFKRVLREQVERIIVSHRVSRKVSGPLHRDTNYSAKEFGPSVRRHRVKLEDLTEKQIQRDDFIKNRGVREHIRRKLESLGISNPAEAFADEKNLPCLPTRNGRTIPIKKIRIQETVKTRQVGEGCRMRYVKPGGPGGNHHLEILGRSGPNGKDREWDTPGVVTMLEAYDRVRKSEAVVRRNPEPGWEFRFSLAPGDTLTFDSGPLRGAYLVVKGISEEERRGSVKIEMVGANDARQKTKIRKAQKGTGTSQWITKSPNELRKWGARRVLVNPLGDVSEAHD